jgi:hypothetical protein
LKKPEFVAHPGTYFDTGTFAHAPWPATPRTQDENAAKTLADEGLWARWPIPILPRSCVVSG